MSDAGVVVGRTEGKEKFSIIHMKMVVQIVMKKGSVNRELKKIPNWALTLVPAAVFWRRLPAAGGYFTPQAYLEF